MKNVIKTVAAAMLLLVGSQAFAQSFGAGYVNSTKTTGNSTSSANGFYVGVNYKAEFAPGLSLNPGIYYEFLTSSNGANVGSIIAADATVQEHYVNVPFHVSYAMNFAPTFKLFVYAGPTANVGIASTTKTTVTSVIGGSSKSINNYDEGYNYSRFDVMLGGGIGAEVMNKIRVNVGYDWGMLDRNTSDNASLHRNRLTAGVAFVF